MTDRENIRAYIEKLHKEHRGSEGDSIFRRALRTVLFYIDSLQEEPASEDFEEALATEWKGYNDRGAATFDALEDNTQELAFSKGFYRGAKWQEKKDQSTIELAEDHAMLAGMEKMKEQMMKDAVDMVVGYWMPNGLMLATDESENCYNIDDGDKVKVIVIKDNQL